MNCDRCKKKTGREQGGGGYQSVNPVENYLDEAAVGDPAFEGRAAEAAELVT
jgi:hypothetical protein